MKSLTEFAQPVLQKFVTAKNALATEGKTPEEIATAMGESFKLEGDKLKYIMTAADLVADKKDYRRVLVATFSEGETAPSKYQKIEDTYYAVETLEAFKPQAPVANTKGGRGGPRQGGGMNKSSGPKTSPWGASPDEIAAKKKASADAARAKSQAKAAETPAKKK